MNGGIQNSLYNKEIAIHNCIINTVSEYFKSLSYTSTAAIHFKDYLFAEYFHLLFTECIGTAFDVFVLLKLFPVKTFR